MSLTEENGPETGGDDMLAAEYVAGLLPEDERRAANRRIESDVAFARLVDRWEARLAPLGNAYQAVEPPVSVKAAVDRRLFSDAARTRLWGSLAFWRGLAVAALAALALVVALPSIRPPVEQQPVRLVASLAAEGSDVRYLAVYDAGRDEVSLSHVSGEPASGRDFELWTIQGGNAPVSMGVLPAGATAHIVITPEIRARLASGAVLAISLEPAGGSPTGQPTGPVVAAGDLKNI
jgi:anti-sigma-K factor RskA